MNLGIKVMGKERHTKKVSEKKPWKYNFRKKIQWPNVIGDKSWVWIPGIFPLRWYGDWAMLIKSKNDISQKWKSWKNMSEKNHMYKCAVYVAQTEPTKCINVQCTVHKLNQPYLLGSVQTVHKLNQPNV